MSDILIVAGVALLLTPFLWSTRLDYIQSREAAKTRTEEKAYEGCVESKKTSRNGKKPVVCSLTRSWIVIPKLEVDAAIVEGHSDSDLDRGPMHLAGTGMPGDGNCCIAAHKEKWFRNLTDLSIGDIAMIRTGGKRYVYVITGHKIVPAANMSVLSRTDVPSLTLITCSSPAYFGHGNGRVIVSGELRTIM